ncbi:choice-of-anchor L domain-containing protein [Synechococcus sp. BA-132 BA5]|uniref:choice-of-anchor L domain-containing protein n=1 Tax=Synechococcus sp. BA-132 BA5 TaxID=3110252 RepID=UPI002B1F1178|nr:choice-of-anchor L domain-containing protein [Synechococcus sp. BA-132 BA5]MEA5416157.1 choice-of-anchor L domain-containing protein [Synechococcus sp. BA-132 BA5]
MIGEIVVNAMVVKACKAVIGGWVSLPAGLLLAMMSTPAKAALSVTSSIDAAAMARALLAPGVNLVADSATYTGASKASGFFRDDTTIFGNPAGVKGVLFTTGDIDNSLGPNDIQDASKENNVSGRSYLSKLIGEPTYDASTLTFQITLDPGTTGLEWEYVFGSEEYSEYVGNPGASFNDAFSLSLNGSNIALIPGSSTPISVNTINKGYRAEGPGTNDQFFRNNPKDKGGINSQYNGLTTVLKASAQGLSPGALYTLSFSIADATDGTNDSGVYIAGASIRAPQPPDGAPVPAPLPLLGAGAAFGWSRRLRRRVGRFQSKGN